MDSSIKNRFTALRAAVEYAACAAGRDPHEVAIVGVGKFHTAEDIFEAARAGLRDFAENRVQEAEEKLPRFHYLLGQAGISPAAIKMHFVGHLQSNKAMKAAALFDMIQSVDSIELVNRLAVGAATSGKILDCLVQVNVTSEATKSGVGLVDAERLAEAIAAKSWLRFKGLMTIGPLTGDSTAIRAAFDRLRVLRDDLQQKRPEWGRLHLSMGMSDDFPIAIAAGATLIRIGTALFGPRVRF